MGFNPDGGGALSTATDVALSSVQNDEVLTYDDVSAKWQNAASRGGRNVKLTVASSDAPDDIKAMADYVCSGTNDQVQINQALERASRIADGFGGSGYIGVQLAGSNFFVGHDGSSITIYPSTALWGNGFGTLIQPFFPSATDKGVIEFVTPETAHVRVGEFTIGRPNPVLWNGTGIKFIGVGDGSNYEIATGSDAFCWISNIIVNRARGKGIWLGGTGGGARETQVSHCLLWNCFEQGLLIEGASDCQISELRANGGGGGFPRFQIGGGNSKVTNCKAFFSGNTDDSPGDGFLISSSRCELTGVSAQDCGGNGFRFTGQDFTAVSVVADSNSRLSSTAAGIAVSSNGVLGDAHCFDRNMTPTSRQERGISLSGSPQVYITGRVSTPSGNDHLTGSPGASSYVRLVRDGTSVYSVG